MTYEFSPWALGNGWPQDDRRLFYQCAWSHHESVETGKKVTFLSWRQFFEHEFHSVICGCMTGRVYSLKNLQRLYSSGGTD